MKRLLSLFLVTAMLMSLTVVAYAEDECSCGKVPIIYVDGINAQPLVTQSGEAAFPPDGKVIATAVISALPAALTGLLFSNGKIAAKGISRAVNTIFEPASMNRDGTPKHDLVVDYDIYEGVTAQRHISDDNRFYFCYDWRLSPIESAKKLNDYIEKVMEVTNHKKVALTSHSCGGSVVLAYLSEFGSNDLDALVFRSSAFCGTSLVGEVLSKRFDIETQAVVNFLNDLLLRSDNRILSNLIAFFKVIGVFDRIVGFANRAVDAMVDSVYTDAMINSFASMPGIWALCAAEYYDATKTAALGNDADKELLKTIDYYHDYIQLNAKVLIDSAISRGVRVAIFSSYNSQGIPLCESNDNNTDNLIDTKYTSGGASVAPLGKTLGDGYVQKINCGHNHISPDRVIDASTCMYPEYTWFIKNLGHSESCADEWATTVWFVESGEQKNVFSDPAHPQFLIFDVQSATLSTFE